MSSTACSTGGGRTGFGLPNISRSPSGSSCGACTDGADDGLAGSPGCGIGLPKMSHGGGSGGGWRWGLLRAAVTGPGNVGRSHGRSTTRFFAFRVRSCSAVGADVNVSRGTNCLTLPLTILLRSLVRASGSFIRDSISGFPVEGSRCCREVISRKKSGLFRSVTPRKKGKTMSL